MNSKFRLQNIVAAIAVIMSAMTMTVSAFPPGISPANKLNKVFEHVSNLYVEPVNQDTLVDEAIRAMLRTLDPHSSYSTPEETRELSEPLEGNFSGVGISFNISTDTIYVISTIAGGPSERVGILPGDRIIAVDDTVVAGVKMKQQEIKRRLRGQKGTRVKVDVLRKGVPEPIEFVITRDDIPIYSIDASYMADKQTGYIRIARFAENTDKEFRQALDKLTASGAKDLIIDLQNNTGGYLSAAHEIASMLLDKGDMVVYTEGLRAPYKAYTVKSSGSFKGRIVVLVNQYSASASEILAGALQDQDRGLIVGRRTYGKGLVQRPIVYPDGSMIRLTTMKYFTPSGRCIQKPYVKGDESAYRDDMKNRLESGELMHSDSIRLDDSLKYKTLKKGRTVYGGGGILPDRFVPLDTAWYTPYYRDIVAKGVLIQYSLNYIDANREQLKKEYPAETKFVEKFEVTPEIINGLIEKAKAEGVEYNEEQFQQSRDYISNILKALIGRDLFDTSTYYMVDNQSNPVYVEGLNLMRDKKTFDKLINGKK